MKYRPFHIISHTADIQLDVQGRTWSELIANALKGTCLLMQPKIKDGSLPLERYITAHGIDREMVLVQFLSECLYYAAIYHETYLDMRIEIATETTITGILIGKPIAQIELEIKAVTYHELAIIYHHELWQTRITYDI